MSYRAGMRLTAGRMPQLVASVESESNFDTTSDDPVELLSMDVELRSDLVYRFAGQTRARALDSGDVPDGLAVVSIQVDGTTVARGRNNVVSTSTAGTNYIEVLGTDFTPDSTDVYTVTMTAGTGTNVSDDLEFRGTGGNAFGHQMAVYVVGVAT